MIRIIACHVKSAAPPTADILLKPSARDPHKSAETKPVDVFHRCTLYAQLQRRARRASHLTIQLHNSASTTEHSKEVESAQSQSSASQDPTALAIA